MDKACNNKGFSLVELIIVIAIMAVLMGAIAPALINNVAKSRESTDLHNIDTIKDAVSYAMAVENVAKAHSGEEQYCVIKYDAATGNNVIEGAVSGGKTFKDLLQEELQGSLKESVELQSGQAKNSNAFIQIEVSSKSAVSVRVVTGAAGKEAVTLKCKYTKDKEGNMVEFISK